MAIFLFYLCFMEKPVAVANYFIEKAIKENVAVTPMKLVKLVYIAHGWHLALTENALIDESVQAWRYGPVIQSLYYATKEYGKSNINCPISVMATGLGIRKETPAILDEEEKPLLDKVWDIYKNFNGPELSTMTHQEGTPWYITWYTLGGKDKLGAIISNDLIKDHYLQKAKERE